MTPEEILTRLGYQVRYNKAICPFCTGRTKYTVSIKGNLYYCHRCERGGSVVTAAKSNDLPPPRIRKADIPKLKFHSWLITQRTRVANEERRLMWRRDLAIVALSFFPDMLQAWTALANYYDAERRIAAFWLAQRDKIGRYWLYRIWRRHNA